MGVLLIVFLTTFYAVIAQEECDIGSVSKLQLLPDNDTLSWIPPIVDNETDCQITYYLIFVNQNGHNSIFFADDNQFNTKQLSRCTLYNFTVSPVSNEIEGKPASIQARTSAAQGESYDITITDIHQEDQNIQISWSLSDGVLGCISHFRLSYWEESSRSPHDIELNDMNYLLTDAVPCMEYKFEVRGILDNLVEGPANSTNFTVQAEVPQVPLLEAVNEFPTSIDLSLNLTGTRITRCRLVEVLVDSSPSFSNVYTDGLNENGLFNITLTGLEPDTAYITKVYAKNDFGSSNPLHAILQTTSNMTDSWDLKQEPGIPS